MASIVHAKQYKEWRMSGVAFEFGNQSYTQPNRTMASYAEVKIAACSRNVNYRLMQTKCHKGILCSGKERGAKKEMRGYWLDLLVSPYFTLGIDSGDQALVDKHAESLFLVYNKDTGMEQHRHVRSIQCLRHDME